MSTDAKRAERKHATVMFADIVGFTALSEAIGPERGYLIVTECLKRLDGIVRKHGGAVDKYLGDCLMAVFGHPVRLENDAAAAAEAALEMRRLVGDYSRELQLEVPLDIHIGLNTGPLVAGELRGGARREFHVLGDNVNVSARLKQRAPDGAIYVGEQTEAETRGRFRYTPLEALKLKGKEAQVRTFELVDQADAAPESDDGDAADLFVAELVGRAPELRRLSERLSALAGGRGGVLHLTGEEGVGKSRLVAELLRSEVARPLHVLRGGVGSGDREGRLRTIRSLFRALVHVGADSDEVRALLESETAAAPGPVVRALGAALTLLARERPVAVVLEDLRDADADSIEVLESLVELTRAQPVLLLLVSRERVVSSETDPERDLELGPLDAEASRVLLESLPESRALGDEIRSAIEARAQGNPRRLILGTFLAPALRSQVEREGGERAGTERTSETERRRATVVFADITGFTSLTEGLGDEQAYAVVADALQLLDDVARKHGGTVDKYLGDCVMAVFGVPHAIEDAPRAAVNASLEMRERIRAFNRERELERPLDVHTGINTGLAISGDISGPLIREFALMGEPVDVANRLSDLAAAGQIFVGPETHRFTRDVFEFRANEPFVLPGGSDPVASFELTSDRQQLHRRRVESERGVFSEVVGRERELGLLREQLDRIAGGAQGSVVHLVGEAGLGKSRLLAELKRLAGERDVRWLEGRSLSVGQQLSYHPFADLFRSLAGITDEDSQEVVPAKLERAVRAVFADETRAVYPLLASILGIPLSRADQQRLESISGSGVQKVLQAHVRELCTTLAAEKPLVLVFDDLHWADLSSVELIESLLTLVTAHPLLVVSVCRPGFAATSEQVRATAAEKVGEHLAEITLEPLGEEAARALINNLFRDADIPFEVRRRIVERSGGNPLYVEEVVRSLIEEGAVEATDRGFRATAKIRDAVIPASVGEVVMARVDRLAPRQKQLLRVASVVGGTFHQEVLERIFDDADALNSDLEALQDGQFIVPWDRLQGTEFAFKHPLVHEVVYEGLIEATREELHLEVGRAIEAALNETFPGFNAMLAYHFSLGKDADRAEAALFRAGDEAARSAASNEALHFFQEASKLYLTVHGEGGDPAKKAELEKNVGTALYNRGQISDACEHFDRALELLGRRVRKAGPALQARFVRDLLGALRSLYLPALRRPRAASDRVREVINIMQLRAESEAFAAPERFAPDTMALVRELLRVDPASVAGADGIHAFAVAIFSVGGVSLAVGQRFLELAERAAEVSGDREPHLLLPVVKFLHHYVSGDWAAEYELDPELVERSVRDARLYEIGIYLTMISQKHALQGDYEAVEHWKAVFDRIWETHEYDGARSGGMAAAMELALGRRRLAEALQATDLYVQENSLGVFRLLGLSYKLSAQVLAGDLDAAEKTLEQAAEIESGQQVGRAYRAIYWSARFRYDVERLAQARTQDREQVRVRARNAQRSGKAAFNWSSRLAFLQPQLRRIEGRRLWLTGQHKQALASLEQGLATAERLGARPDLGRTFRELARRLAEDDGPTRHQGHEAAHYADRAREIFEELSLEHDLEELRTSA